MTPWHHAVSSARKWGGKPEDFIAIHDWFDETKSFTGDWTHRALRHHSAGVQWCIERFGHTVMADGKPVPVKLVAEQHVNEDCGFIPAPHHYLTVLRLHPEPWMLRVGVKHSSIQMKESHDTNAPAEPR